VIMRRIISTIGLVAALCWAAPVQAAPNIQRIEVSGPRVSVAQVLDGRPDLAHVDLCSAPAPGGSRVITRKQVLQAIANAADEHVLKASKIPKSIRITRKMQSLDAPAVESMLRRALVLKKGVVLTAVNARNRIKVAAGWNDVEATIPKPPRKTGSWRTNATLRFKLGGATVSTTSVPVVFELDEEAARPDVERGAAIELVVRRGSIEIRTRGFAATDADIGSVFPVRLRPKGKIVRAKLVSKRRAVALEDS